MLAFFTTATAQRKKKKKKEGQCLQFEIACVIRYPIYHKQLQPLTQATEL